jgi:hypothetical protein
MPSWSGLIHFNQVVSVNFTDAKKLDHLVKVLLKLLVISIITNMISPRFCYSQATI